MPQTIFERAGGFATVRRVVSSFYERVLESPALGPYFEHVDMRRQIDHQTKFVTSVMGGPASYTDDHHRRVHQHMSISHPEFVELVGYLREALEDHMGLHTGPVIGSIVGVQKYVYDIFGPGVNLSARLEALAEPMQIVTSQETLAFIQDEFVCTPLGEIDVKGFGLMPIFSIDEEIRGRR